jgi:hypothetical protein
MLGNATVESDRCCDPDWLDSDSGRIMGNPSNPDKGRVADQG